MSSGAPVQIAVKAPKLQILARVQTYQPSYRKECALLHLHTMSISDGAAAQGNAA
jgi:hypothetical protein